MSGSAGQNYSLRRPFCDAIIRVDGVEFHVHKIIFCDCSDYFEALIIRHSTPNRTFFEIPGLSADMMHLIVEFAYTGSVHVTESNVLQLFEAADQLNITGIVRACCNFLVERLSPNNCIGIWQFTNINFSPELQHKACHYILNHFEEVVSSQEFQQFSVQELCYILCQDELNVRQESTVYEAIFKWISHAPEGRNTHFAILLSKVRLGLTSLEFLMDVMSNMCVCGNDQGLDVVKHAIRVRRHMTSTRPPLSICSNTIARPRLPNTVLLAIGGWSARSPTNAIEAYDIRTNQWKNVTDLRESPRAYHGSVIYNDSVYCVGGFNEGGSSNTVRRFDLKTRTWHEAAPMHQRRCYVTITVLNGYIYAIGGRDGARRLRTAERYNPKTNQWSFIAPMHVIRSDSSCTVLNNRIYICGGFNGNECLGTCEYYTPETDKWARFNPMNVQRSGLGVVAYGHQIFAVGGFDGVRRLRSVETYNPETNTWNVAASMLTSRSNFGIAVIENKVFAVGGFHDVTTINNVEYYDASTGRWSAAGDMEITRSALSCCVVSKLPNIADYLISRDTLPQLDEEACTVETEDAH